MCFHLWCGESALTGWFNDLNAFHVTTIIIHALDFVLHICSCALCAYRRETFALCLSDGVRAFKIKVALIYRVREKASNYPVQML